MVAIPTEPKNQALTATPDWREVFARAISGECQRLCLNWRGLDAAATIDLIHDTPNLADAILAAIAERGYRLHRDHDYQRVGLASHLKCTRCGQRSDGLIPHSSCGGEP